MAVAVGSAEAAADVDLPAAEREATAGREATAVWDRAGMPEASGAGTVTTEVGTVTTEVDTAGTEVGTATTEVDTVTTEVDTARLEAGTDVDGDTDVDGGTVEVGAGVEAGAGVIRGGASAHTPRTRMATAVTRTTTRTAALMATRPATDAGTR